MQSLKNVTCLKLQSAENGHCLHRRGNVRTMTLSPKFISDWSQTEHSGKWILIQGFKQVLSLFLFWWLPHSMAWNKRTILIDIRPWAVAHPPQFMMWKWMKERITAPITQIGGKWALDLHFTLLLIHFSMLISYFATIGRGPLKRRPTLSAALRVPFLTTWVVEMISTNIEIIGFALLSHRNFMKVSAEKESDRPADKRMDGKNNVSSLLLQRWCGMKNFNVYMTWLCHT